MRTHSPAHGSLRQTQRGTQRPPAALTQSRTSSVKCTALFQVQTPRKDATSELLSGAINLALRTRLEKYGGIHVDVQSNALDLLGGKFGGMTVTGRHWRTPLQLTADTIQVAVGELMVDQNALLFQQKVALKNIPLGSCTLILSPMDLGHFMVHDIMKPAASKAVQGQPFAFDPCTVRFVKTGSTSGQVVYHGTCTTDKHAGPQQYEVAMDAAIHPMTSPKTSHAHTHRTHNSHHRTSHSHSSHNSHTGHSKTHRARTHAIVVNARRLSQHPAHHNHPHHHNDHHSHSHSKHGSHAAAAAVPVAETLAVPQPADAAHASPEQLVSRELSQLFTHLRLNLQGVELSTPQLRLLSRTGLTGTSTSSSSSSSGAPDDLLLEIHAQLRLLDLPPLNMQF